MAIDAGLAGIGIQDTIDRSAEPVRGLTMPCLGSGPP